MNQRQNAARCRFILNRRDLMVLLSGPAICSPLMARAQQKATPIIGFLNSASPAPFANYVAAFRRGLQDEGYVEGQNLAIEFRWAEGQNDRLATLAADLINRQVSLIAATGGPASAFAAKAATDKIPIVFTMAGDPVKRGLVASLNRPGGNITGYNFVAAELDGKRLGMLHDLVPNAAPLAALLDPKTPNFEAQTKDIEAAAQTLGRRITIITAASTDEIDAVLAKSGVGDAAALLIGADPFFNSQRKRIVERVGQLALPAIYEVREFVDAGGLISYGTNIANAYRQIGAYAGRILKGEKPANLPVIQPTRFELVINLKTANAIGLTVPPMLLTQADDVIE